MVLLTLATGIPYKNGRVNITISATSVSDLIRFLMDDMRCLGKKRAKSRHKSANNIDYNLEFIAAHDKWRFVVRITIRSTNWFSHSCFSFLFILFLIFVWLHWSSERQKLNRRAAPIKFGYFSLLSGTIQMSFNVFWC